MGIAQFYTLSHQHKWTFGVINQFSSLLYRYHISIWHWVVAAYILSLRRLIVNHLCLGTLGEIEHHRTWATTFRDIECTGNGLGNIISITNHVTPLGDRLCQTYPIDLLEGIGTQGTYSHLASDHHNRCTVNHGIGNASHRIRSSRATGHEAYTYFTRDTGKSFCCMGRSLLMAHQYMMQCVHVVKQGIIDRHDATTWIAKNRLYSLVLQCTHQSF